MSNLIQYTICPHKLKNINTFILHLLILAANYKNIKGQIILNTLSKIGLMTSSSANEHYTGKDEKIIA